MAIEDVGNRAFEEGLGEDPINTHLYATQAELQEIIDALNALGTQGIDDLVDDIWALGSLAETDELSTSVYVLAIMQ